MLVEHTKNNKITAQKTDQNNLKMAKVYVKCCQKNTDNNKTEHLMLIWTKQNNNTHTLHTEGQN